MYSPKSITYLHKILPARHTLNAFSFFPPFGVCMHLLFCSLTSPSPAKHSRLSDLSYPPFTNVWVVPFLDNFQAPAQMAKQANHGQKERSRVPSNLQRMSIRLNPLAHHPTQLLSLPCLLSPSESPYTYIHIHICIHMVYVHPYTHIY